MANKHTLEERLDSLEKRYQTLYQRTYAYHERRSGTLKKRELQLRSWVKRTEKFDASDWATLGGIVAMLKAKRGLVTFTRKESLKLRWFLNNRLTDPPVDNDSPGGTD